VKEKSIRVLLLVEDNPGDVGLLPSNVQRTWLTHTELTMVRCMRDAEKHLEQGTPDIIVLDLGLPDAQGLEALRRARAAAPRVPLVVLTALDDESLAAQALHEGAQDYLIKGQIEPRGLFRACAMPSSARSWKIRCSWKKERAQVILNSIGDAVICTDVSGNIASSISPPKKWRAGRGSKRQAGS